MQTLSANLQAAFDTGTFEPVLILEVEGLPVCASAPISKLLRFDDSDFDLDDGQNFDLPSIDRNVEILIDVKSSSNSLTQQMNQDQAGSNSAQSFAIALVDKQEIVTEWITPGLVIDEIIGKKARIYLNTREGIHPGDSLLIMSGVIDGYTGGNNLISPNVVSAENVKRSSIFLPASTTIVDYPDFSTTLIAAVGDGYDDFQVADSSGFPPSGFYESRVLIKVGNDITTYSSVGAGVLHFITRPENIRLLPSHAAYPAGTVVSVYRIFPAGKTDSLNLVDSSEIMFSQNPALETYVKIEDEIIKIGSRSPGQSTALVRGALGTVAVDHPFGAQVDTLYRLKGNIRDLSLMIMLSGAGVFYEDDVITLTAGGSTIPNAIFIDDPRLAEAGAVPGDLVYLYDSNDKFVLKAKIVSFGSTESYQYIVIDQPMTARTDLYVQLISKYDVLPEGAGLALTPDLVDVAEHEAVYNRFFTQLMDLDFYLSSEITARELINSQIYFPNGAIPIPRKGKASIGVIAPPLTSLDPLTLDASNVISPGKIKLSRSMNRYFYNAVIYKYGLDVDGSTYKAGNVYLSQSSINRIRVPTKALTIQADGIRATGTAKLKLDAQSKRFLERFQYGAETLENIQVSYSVGMRIEIGDSVVFDGSLLNISDTANGNGTRSFKSRIMEVCNKSSRFFANEVILTLIDTSYSVNARYGLIAPSTLIGDGATARVLPMKASYGTLVDGGAEGDKWGRYVGQSVLIRSEDWSFSQEKIIQQIQGANMILDSNLSFVPAENYIIDAPAYPSNSDAADHQFWKSQHVFFTPQVKVTATSTATDRFTVATADASRFLPGAVVTVHNSDYSDSSDDILVKSVTGSTVILSRALPFTPNASHLVDLIGFKDGGQPYRWA